MKAGILVFPGTNCENDLARVLKQHYNAQVEFIWHEHSFLPNHDAYFVAGGFSYGDYLRSGAMASIAKSLDSLRKAVSAGRKVLGICNGFQILTESGLLPGALIKNQSLKHICRWVKLKPQSKVLSKLPTDSFYLPISHSEGNYYCQENELKQLEDDDNVLLRYVENINGSVASIAGIKNSANTVFGLMPHPERAFHNSLDAPLASKDSGKSFLDAFLNV